MSEMKQSKLMITPAEWKPAFWIFQAKPERYDLTEDRRLEPGHVTRWLVSRYEQEIRGGDIVFLWRAKGKTGQERGIWGWGVAAEDAPQDDRMPVYVLDGFPQAVEAPRIQQIRGLENLSILRSAMGTNFRVTDDEARILVDLIKEVGGLLPPLPGQLQPPLTISSRRALEGARQIAAAAGLGRIHLAHLVMGIALEPGGKLAADLQSSLERRGIPSDRYLGELWARLADQSESLPSLDYDECPPVDFLPRLSPHGLRALLEADRIRKQESREWVEHDDLIAGVQAMADARESVVLSELLAPAEHLRGEKTARDPLLSTYLSDSARGQDKLGVEVDARAMVALIASHNLEPPLAIGLFGGWGSGKSFFMSLVQTHVERFCRAGRAAAIRDRPTAYCQRDLHIRFNAWHYADASLWASLVNEILEGVAQHLRLALSPQEKRDRLVRELETYDTLVREARQQEAAAGRALKEAEAAHERAAARKQTAAGLLRAAETLGLTTEDEVQRLAEYLRKRLRLLSSIVRRLLLLGKRPRLLLALLLVIAGGSLAANDLELSFGLTSAGAEFARRVSGVAAVVIGALPIASGWRALTALSVVLEKSEALSEKPPKVDPSKNEDEVLAPYRETERRTAGQVAELERRQQQLRIQIEGLDPQQQLRQLIQNRTAADSPYRQAEGLIAQIRRDFRSLKDHIQAIESQDANPSRPLAPPLRIVSCSTSTTSIAASRAASSRCSRPSTSCSRCRCSSSWLRWIRAGSCGP